MKASKAKLWGFMATSEDCGTLTANALLHKSADVKKLSFVFIFTPFSPSLLESALEQMVMSPLHGHWVGGMGSELVSSSTSASPPRESLLFVHCSLSVRCEESKKRVNCVLGSMREELACTTTVKSVFLCSFREKLIKELGFGFRKVAEL